MSSLILIPVILLSLFILMLCMSIPDEVWGWIFIILFCWPFLLLMGIVWLANKIFRGGTEVSDND